jgi:hypothetical protein
MIRQLISNSNDAILKVPQNSVNIVVTQCLTKDEVGEVTHSKCSGYYLDNYGLGYTVRCLCKCHNNEEDGVAN